MAVASQQSQGVAPVPLDSQPQSVKQSEIPTPQLLGEQAQAVQLPPSERDWEVFDEVVVQRLSTRQVAARHGVSQTRIVQIRRKVALWMATMPDEPELTPVQQIRLAAEIAAKQIDNLCGEAMQAWYASKQPQAECRSQGGETRMVRGPRGDSRYSPDQQAEEPETQPEEPNEEPEQSAEAVPSKPIVAPSRPLNRKERRRRERLLRRANRKAK